MWAVGRLTGVSVAWKCRWRKAEGEAWRVECGEVRGGPVKNIPEGNS